MVELSVAVYLGAKLLAVWHVPGRFGYSDLCEQAIKRIARTMTRPKFRYRFTCEGSDTRRVRT